MDEILNIKQNSKISKPEIENVENEKEEYKLIGTFFRRKGLKLYSYSSMTGKLAEVSINKGDLLHIVNDGNGGLTVIDPEFQKAMVNSNDTHFEALNYSNAKRRLRKFKDGLIKELCNLKEPGDGIKFY